PARGGGGSLRRLVAVSDALSQQLDGQTAVEGELPFGVDHNNDPRRPVGCPHCRGGLVPVLSTRAAGAASDDVDVRLGERRVEGINLAGSSHDVPVLPAGTVAVRAGGLPAALVDAPGGVTAETRKSTRRPWEVEDRLWERIAPLLPQVKHNPRYPGRPRL